MSNTSDFSLANQNGANFRTELNNVLGDIQSTNSGTSEPSTKVAFKLWIDSTNSKIKIRNSSNNAWIELGSISQDMGHALAASPSLTGTVTSSGDIVCNSTGRMKLPVGTTAERPGSGATGDTRWNSTLEVQETYNGSSWLPMGGVPAGSIHAYAAEAAPTGYLECAGQTISRSTYSVLFGVIGTRFGVGDGSSTFEIPDLRGQFVRGWANGSGTDPDRATRTDSGDGSTTGDKVGTKQASENKSHTHDILYNTGSFAGSSGAVTPRDTGTITDRIGSTGGTESRPTNIALMYIIKY